MPSTVNLSIEKSAAIFQRHKNLWLTYEVHCFPRAELKIENFQLPIAGGPEWQIGVASSRWARAVATGRERPTAAGGSNEPPST
jgi:hypothetical protein